MKVIAAIAEKGGVGKTAIACVVAAGLRLAGARVLVVGLDIQPAAAAVFALPHPGVSGVAQLLLGEEVQPVAGHLDVEVLSGGPALDGGDIRALRSDELRFGLQRLADRYDAVVIDVAPVILHLHRLALDAADLALVISDAQCMESLASLAKLIGEIATAKQRQAYSPGEVIPVINKVNRSHTLDCQLADQVAERYGADHTIIEIPHANIVPTAIARRRPEMALNAHSPVQQPFRQLIAQAGQLIVRSPEWSG